MTTAEEITSTPIVRTIENKNNSSKQHKKDVFIDAGSIIPSRTGNSIKIFDNENNFVGFTSRIALFEMLRSPAMYPVPLYKKQTKKTGDLQK